MKAQLLLPLTVSFILNVFFLTQGLAAQQNGVQVDVAAVYQKALPGIKKIRKFLKAENTFDARIYRRLRNGLKKGNYTLVSNILKHIENAGGNKVDAEVEKLRTLLGKNGVALFQNTQGGGDNLVAKKPVSIHWTGYVGGNRAKIGQIPALSAPTLNPATASASYAATPSTVCTVDAKTGVLAIVGVGNCKITLTATPSDPSTHTVTKASLIVTIDSGTQTISSSNPYGSGASALVIGESLALQSAPTGGVTTLEYQTTNSGVCTVGANSGDVTADTTGSCVVQARWTASSDYNASPWTTIHTFTVSKKNQSAVTVANPYGQNPSVKVDATLAIATAPAGGYGTLEYQSGDTGACTVNASGAVTGVSTVGTCTIQARFAGNNAYTSTPWANIATIAVNAKEVAPTPVTVSWRGYAEGNEARVGQTAPALRAPVLSPPAARASYSAAPAKVCSIESATGKLSVHGAGICRIALTATDGQTSAMANITVLVHKGEQSAPAAKGLYGPDPGVNIGATLAVSAAPSGGHGRLEYQSTTSHLCAVDTATGEVSGSASGNCLIQVRWTGDANYLASPWANTSFIAVTKEQRQTLQLIGNFPLEVQNFYTVSSYLGEVVDIKLGMKNPGTGTANYSLSSSSSWIISASPGQIGAGENVVVPITLICQESTPETLSGTLNITAGGKTAAVKVELDCIKRTELLSIRSWPAPSPFQARMGETVASGLHFGWYDDYLTNYGRGSVGYEKYYKVTTNTPDVTIQDSEGTSTETDQWQIYFPPYYYKVTHTCKTPGYKEIEFTLKVTFERRNYGSDPGKGIEGRVKKVIWPVNCLPDDSPAVQVSFFQGPLISELRYTKKGSGWSVQPYHASSMIEGRKTFLGVRLKHASSSSPSLKARIGSTTVTAFDTKTSNDDSGNYTEYTYELPGSSVRQYSQLLLIVTSGGEFSSPHNAITVALREFPFLPPKPLKFRFVPIRRENEKPLDKKVIATNALEYKKVLEDFLPVSSVEAEVGEEIVLDHDGLAGSIFSPLKPLRYKREGKNSQTFYYFFYPCQGTCLNKGARGSLAAMSGISRGGTGFPSLKTVVHEAGHGFGLGHPDDSLSSGYLPYQLGVDIWPRAGGRASLGQAKPYRKNVWRRR